MDIGKRIAYLRKEKNVTQAQLADYLSVTPQTVSRWEANNGTPDVYLLPEIAIFFDVPLEQLFGIDDLERITKLVYKYSILRDERSYDDAMRAIENGLLEAREEKQKQSLLAQKMHMYLQKSRAYLDKADELADKLVKETQDEDNPLHLSIRFQKIQFEVLRGNETEIVDKMKEEFEKNPSVINVLTYACSLLESFKYEKLLELFSKKGVDKFKNEGVEPTKSLYDMAFVAAYKLRNLTFFKENFETFEGLFSVEEGAKERLLLSRLLYARLIKNTGEKEEMKTQRDILLREVEEFSKNEFLYDLFMGKIKDL